MSVAVISIRFLDHVMCCVLRANRYLTRSSLNTLVDSLKVMRLRAKCDALQNRLNVSQNNSSSSSSHLDKENQGRGDDVSEEEASNSLSNPHHEQQQEQQCDYAELRVKYEARLYLFIYLFIYLC